MNIRYIILTLLLALTTGAWGQNAVAIHQIDGEVAVFAFSEKPIVTYSGNELVMTTSTTTVRFPIYKLQKLAFDIEYEDPTAIDEVEANANFDFRGETLCINGGKPGETVNIYDLKGTKIGKFRLDSEGCATIPMQNFDKQVYIVKTSKFNFKFKH